MACLRDMPRDRRYDAGMAKSHGAMHVATVTSRQVDKAGRQRQYQSHLVRRTYREDGKVKHQTLANITALPPAAIAAIRAVMPLTEIPQSCSAKFLTLRSCQGSGSVGVHGVSPFVE